MSDGGPYNRRSHIHCWPFTVWPTTRRLLYFPVGKGCVSSSEYCQLAQNTRVSTK